MSDRTYGETRNCAGCRYWSEMLAQARGGRVEAMCLATDQPTRYTPGWHTCESWQSGYMGAIDEPGDDPMRYEVADEVRQP